MQGGVRMSARYYGVGFTCLLLARGEIIFPPIVRSRFTSLHLPIKLN
jgi:hypothetical protein